MFLGPYCNYFHVLVTIYIKQFTHKNTVAILYEKILIWRIINYINKL
jgi:hypothetical protein